MSIAFMLLALAVLLSPFVSNIPTKGPSAMTYHLFIDDIRFPHPKECVKSGIDLTKDWVIARTTAEARAIVEARGMPTSLALDHDLGELPTGGIDEVPDFLNWLAREYWDGESPIVESYTVHSSNTPGVERIISIMESWKKSLRL